MQTTIISCCKKSDFKTVIKYSDKYYFLNWGCRTDENDEDWCTYESSIYRGVLTPYLLDKNVLSVAKRHPHLDELYEIYKSIGVKEEQILILLKGKLKEEILRYDSSSSVNSFTIQGKEVWIDKATRVGLKLRFEAEKRLGKTETTLWQNGMQFTLPLSGDVTALDMLDGIELYASACYDNTQMHLATADRLTSVDEIKDYDYTSGYPKKLSF